MHTHSVPHTISIIVPAYNEAKLITQCLDAIALAIADCNYTFQVVVVDNASTDRTASIAAGYDFVTVLPEPEKGLVKARETGHNATTGEIEMHIDADSIITANWIHNVVDTFDKDPVVVAVSGPYVFYDLSAFNNFLVLLYVQLTYLLNWVNSRVFKSAGVIQGGNFALKRAAIDSVGGFNSKDFQFYGEDADLAKRLIQVGKIHYSSKMRIASSGRRLQEEGIVRVGARYAFNYIWVALYGKPYTKTYKDIRP